MPNRFTRWILTLVLFPLLYALPLQAADPVRLQLLWKHQFQFGGYYMAVEKGFYADEGLDVELIEMHNGIEPSTEIMSGRVEFAVGRSSLLISSAKDNNLVALFAAFQQSPLMLLTTKQSEISRPSDLRGKRIMITNDAKRVGELLAMLLQSDISSSDFIQQPHSYNINDLIEGNTDAMASYISNEPYIMAQQGVKYNIIHPKDFGFDMYSDILFTSREFARKNPDLTERFYRASLRGWQYAFDHIEETAEVIFKGYNSQNKTLEALVFEGRELKKLAYDDNGDFGTLSMSKFNQMAQVYLITNSIFRDYNFDGLIYQPASNRLRFTQKELEYLDQTDTVKVCINPDWYPYEAYRDGRHEGMISDYLEQAMKDIGLNYTIVPSETWRETLIQARQGRCDLVAGAMQTVQRSDYLRFSRPYLSIPAVVATLPEKRNIVLKDQRIAVKDKSAFHDILQDRFPAAELVPVRNMSDGFHLVRDGEVDALVGAEASLMHKLRENQITGIAISDLLHDNWDISIAVRNDQATLLSVINKAITSFSPELHDQISKRWFQVDFNTVVDYSLIWKVLGGIALLAALGFYRYQSVLRYNQRITELAERDELTGILSRRKTRQELEAFIALSERHDWALSLIFFDIDDFKKINDTLGHGAGDKVLIDLAALVSGEIRKTDRFGRWGGEEFIFLTLESNLEQAQGTAEKLRISIAEHDFQIGRPITCSFGVAQYQKGSTIEHLIGNADEAMYQAKHSGKNCVKVAAKRCALSRG